MCEKTGLMCEKRVFWCEKTGLMCQKTDNKNKFLNYFVYLHFIKGTTNKSASYNMEKSVEIRQHNAITTARYEYSELQLDIFFYLLSLLDKNKKDGVYSIVFKDLSAVTGKKYEYAYLRRATEEMGSRMFEVETSKSYTQLWMFQRVEYIIGEGRIEIELSNPIKPYLFDLKDNFTSFELHAALKLGSKYAKRIYALCSRWKDQGTTPVFKIDELKKMLSLIDDKGNEQYRQIGQFKQFVLDEGVKQINQHTDLQIGYTLQKQGRSFESVRFSIKQQPVAIIPLVREQPTSVVPEAQYKNARMLLEKWGIRRSNIVSQILNSADLIKEINKFGYELETGKVQVQKNIAGYILTRLGLK